MSKFKGLTAAAPSAPNDYQAEDDMRTMQRVHEIFRDRKRMKGAHKHAKRQLDNLKDVTGYVKGMIDSD